MSPSTLIQRCWIFLASGLIPGPAAPDPEEADLRTASFTRAEVEQMIVEGAVTDAKPPAIAWVRRGADGLIAGPAGLGVRMQ